jgi:hypothetical protein
MEQVQAAIVWLFTHPLAFVAYKGAWVAAGVDLVTFRSFKRWNEFAAFDWNVATLRWAQGALFAVLGTLGWAALTSQ